MNPITPPPKALREFSGLFDVDDPLDTLVIGKPVSVSHAEFIDGGYPITPVNIPRSRPV
jgi:hypothetical protein